MRRCIQAFVCVQCLSIIGIEANPLYGEAVTKATPKEFQFMVSLATLPADKPEFHFCGGALIAKRVILTAKHCLFRPDGELIRPYHNIKVSIGSHIWLEGKPFQIVDHRKYEEWAVANGELILNPHNDIVIAELDHDAENITPAQISQLSQDQLYRYPGMVPGWGMITGGTNPTHLHKAELKIAPPKYAESTLSQSDHDVAKAQNHVIATGREVVLAPNDHGGPLLVEGHIAGVNSFTGYVGSLPTNSYALVPTFSGHAAIACYRNFINSVVNEYEKKHQKESEASKGPESSSRSSTKSSSGSTSCWFDHRKLFSKKSSKKD